MHTFNGKIKALATMPGWDTENVKGLPQGLSRLVVAFDEAIYIGPNLQKHFAYMTTDTVAQNHLSAEQNVRGTADVIGASMLCVKTIHPYK